MHQPLVAAERDSGRLRQDSELELRADSGLPRAGHSALPQERGSALPQERGSGPPQEQDFGQQRAASVVQTLFVEVPISGPRPLPRLRRAEDLGSSKVARQLLLFGQKRDSSL